MTPRELEIPIYTRNSCPISSKAFTTMAPINNVFLAHVASFGAKQVLHGWTCHTQVANSTMSLLAHIAQLDDIRRRSVNTITEYSDDGPANMPSYIGGNK